MKPTYYCKPSYWDSYFIESSPTLSIHLEKLHLLCKQEDDKEFYFAMILLPWRLDISEGLLAIYFLYWKLSMDVLCFTYWYLSAFTFFALFFFLYNLLHNLFHFYLWDKRPEIVLQHKEKWKSEMYFKYLDKSSSWK